MLKIGFIEAIEQNKEFNYQWYKDKKEWQEIIKLSVYFMLFSYLF